MQWLLRFDRAPRGHSRARPLHAHVACTCTAHTCSCPHAATAGADAPSVVSHACLRLAHLGRESPCAKLPSAAARDGVHIRPAMKCGVPRSQACARVDVHPSVTQVVVTPALRRDHRNQQQNVSCRASWAAERRHCALPLPFRSALACYCLLLYCAFPGQAPGLHFPCALVSKAGRRQSITAQHQTRTKSSTRSCVS